MSRSSEGQGNNAACLWKGVDLSNSVCEYEVNPLTNDSYYRNPKLEHKMIKLSNNNV